MLMACPRCGELIRGQTGDQCQRCKIFLRPAAELREEPPRQDRREDRDEPDTGLALRCPGCGMEQPVPTAKYCLECGARLDAGPVRKRGKGSLIGPAGWILLALVLAWTFYGKIKPPPRPDASSSALSSTGGESLGASGAGSEESGATTGERDALSRARVYVKQTGVSYKGLLEQLEFEGYSHSEAVYGAEHCGADWKREAAQRARAYSGAMSFSRADLIEQLEREGFTHEEAVYGVEQNGY